MYENRELETQLAIEIGSLSMSSARDQTIVDGESNWIQGDLHKVECSDRHLQ